MKKAILIKFQITRRVIVNVEPNKDIDIDDLIDNAIEKVAADPTTMELFCSENVESIEWDNECPYNAEYDD